MEDNKGTKRELPFRADKVTGHKGELILLVKSLRRFSKVRFNNTAEEYFFEYGWLIGDSYVEERLSLNLETVASVDIMSAEEITPLLEEAPHVDRIVLKVLIRSDEARAA
jgi:hypothetical protein